MPEHQLPLCLLAQQLLCLVPDLMRPSQPFPSTAHPSHAICIDKGSTAKPACHLLCLFSAFQLLLSFWHVCLPSSWLYLAPEAIMVLSKHCPFLASHVCQKNAELPAAMSLCLFTQ